MQTPKSTKHTSLNSKLQLKKVVYMYKEFNINNISSLYNAYIGPYNFVSKI